MGKRKGVYRVWWGNLKEGDPWTSQDNIKMDLREVGWGHELHRSGSGQRQLAGSCEYGNEPSASIKCGEFLD
jgi:hypothetical protein